MDRVLLGALSRGAPEGEEASIWGPPEDGGSPGMEGPPENAAAPHPAFDEWKIYFALAVAVLVVLAGLSFLCFSFKRQNWAQFWMCGTVLDELGDDDFDIPWNIPIIDRPEIHGPCLSPPQPVPRIRGARQPRNVSPRLPYAPKDLGILSHRCPPSQTSGGGIGQASPVESHENGVDPAVGAIFKIEDLD